MSARTGDDEWGHIEAERLAVAELLASLSEPEANTPSLCDRWRVRDVAGHLYWIATSRAVDVTRDFLLAGGRINVMMDAQAVAAGSMPTEQLAAKLRGAAGSRLLSPGFPPIGYLSDIVVHHQDMLRPLGRTREIPPERLTAALEHYVGSNRFTGGKRRTRGLRLVATDLDWSRGAGPEVVGAGEALLMASVGRAVALDDLDGPGVELLRSRQP